MSLQERALLVTLNISTWTANKLDRQKTNSILAQAGADVRAGKFHKNLMSGTKLAKDINDYAAKCRLWNTQQTLPWENGKRLIASSQFLDYKQELNEKRRTFWGKVSTLESEFDEGKEVARIHLGSLFNEDDYPSVEEVVSKYAFDWKPGALPESGHLCVDIPAEDLEEARKEISGDADARIKDAMGEAWKRLHTMCTDISKKLTKLDDEDAENKKRWHGSFVTNPIELCHLMSHLNITNDPELEAARRKLENTMANADIEVIKEAPAVREALKKDVDSIINEFEW